ncbi:transport-associated ob type 2 [Lucifera butyrica]|uniref:Transport-associated ob type 2 n=1 Tax=Lucifera butyrica TaxID=1351585 RepID=A0A498RF02_9FIRM|nr:sn-glycerol-3-phosphate ABC transporter ATP-binding protein UgpC [Lucifera butyrica]VBB09390.1 transport-associated ob type 2 [Lucifera butyrica]
MATVTLQNISKQFANHTAVATMNLTIADGEFLVLVGPSGCGKTTTLRMIAGLETPSSGNLFIGETDVTHREPKDRDIAMVFQNYALYPHMTVRANLAYSLRLRRRPREEIARRIEETAAMLEITALLDRYPRQLSGGQQQRAALGRAIVRQPQVFLMDEPLSNLDARLRAATRAELIQLHQRLKTTIVYVTHDQVEAMTMGSRIVVMNDGVVQQVGAPLEIYRRPANRFVASFIGSPPMQFLQGTVNQTGEQVSFTGRGFRLKLSSAAPEPVLAGEMILGIRPEHLVWEPAGQEDGTGIPCVVAVVENIGSEALIHTTTAGGEGLIIKMINPERTPLPGENLTVKPGPGSIYLFTVPDGVCQAVLPASADPDRTYSLNV